MIKDLDRNIRLNIFKIFNLSVYSILKDMFDKIRGLSLLKMSMVYSDKTGYYWLKKESEKLYTVTYKEKIYSFVSKKLYLEKGQDNKWDLRFFDFDLGPVIISKCCKETDDIEVDHWDKETMLVPVLELIEMYKKNLSR